MLRRSHVDHEPIPRILGDDGAVGFRDLLRLDDLHIGGDVAGDAVVDHFLRLGHPADQGACKAPAASKVQQAIEVSSVPRERKVRYPLIYDLTYKSIYWISFAPSTVFDRSRTGRSGQRVNQGAWLFVERRPRMARCEEHPRSAKTRGMDAGDWDRKDNIQEMAGTNL